MSTINLKPGEAKILSEASARGGRLVFPDRIKDSTRQRMVGLFEKEGLATAADGELHLTEAGYCAVGAKPPRVPVTGEERGAKKTLVLAMLGRGEGASLQELVSATGWLPHTTRAVLSRLRSAGQELAKSKRQDGTTAYRIIAPAAALALTRSKRRRPAEMAAEAAA